MIASQLGDVDIVRQLLQHPSVDVNAVDNVSNHGKHYSNLYNHVDQISLKLG